MVPCFPSQPSRNLATIPTLAIPPSTISTGSVRFLQALILAYNALQKDHGIAVRAVTNEMKIKKEWVEQIYRDAPPPRIHLWADPRYVYSLVKGARFHRRLGYLAKFMFDEKVFPKEVETNDVLDVSVVTEALRTQKQPQ